MIDEKKLIEELNKYCGNQRYLIPEDVWNIIENQQKINEWIPVSEKLPKLGETVICCNEDDRVFTSAITYKRPQVIGNTCSDFGQHFGVTAWMPLLEPYKEKEQTKIKDNSELEDKHIDYEMD